METPEWKNHQESDTCTNDLTLVGGVVTRSRSKSKKTKNKEIEKDAVQSQVADGTYDQHSSLEESPKQMEMRTSGSASRVSDGPITGPKIKEMKKTLKTSAVRRSARLKSTKVGVWATNAKCWQETKMSAHFCNKVHAFNLILDQICTDIFCLNSKQHSAKALVSSCVLAI